jgi:hypothetical protein
MRAGMGLVRETIDRAPLPTPVAAVAGGVLRGVDHLAQQADRTASTFLRGFLGTTDVATDDEVAQRVVALTAALRGALSELGAGEARVSKRGVRAAIEAHASPGEPAVRAADLMVCLLAASAVSPPAPTAVFAALLADSLGHSSDRVGIAASAALADALGGEIAAAGTDRDSLARLFAEFRDHV